MRPWNSDEEIQWVVFDEIVENMSFFAGTLIDCGSVITLAADVAGRTFPRTYFWSWTFIQKSKEC